MSSEKEQNLVQLVEETMRTLHGKGIPLEDLAPLVKLHDAVTALNNTQKADAMPPAPVSEADVPPEHPGHFIREARLAEMKASEELMARGCAIIDVMIQGGQTPEHASQVITRQLLSVGIELPEHGGDVRAWKRLMSFRNTLIHYMREGPVRNAYSAFKEQLSGIEPDQRLRRAVGEQ
ncbi:MAG: hypothetical protein ACTSP0_10070, partial [Alphaproteobacteria bacterium]